MNNKEFVAKLKDIVENYKTLYVLGCFGAPLVSKPFDNVKRYTSNYSYNAGADRRTMIMAAADKKPVVFGFDCVCLIKAVLWGWRGDASKTYGGATYLANGVPDIGADQMIRECKGVSTDFSKIEVGEAVWLSGHIGIYIGDGLAIECTPAFNNNVQITAVRNIGAKAGYNARTWTKHGKLPYIDYVATPQATSKKELSKVVDEVIKGKWGVGADRKRWLKEAGYDPDEVQRLVNEKLKSSSKKKTVDEIAYEVIDGKWGVGADRKKRLKEAGYNPDDVQRRVNEKLRKLKSIDEVADEVLDGMWGNGAERKKRLKDAGYDVDAVQRRVNEKVREV